MTKNKMYIKGRSLEYRYKGKLEKKGYIVTRAAGSHSPFDLIAVHKEKKTVLFIQCKAGEFRDSEKKKLEEEYAWLTGKVFLPWFFVNPDMEKL